MREYPARAGRLPASLRQGRSAAGPQDGPCDANSGPETAKPRLACRRTDAKLWTARLILLFATSRVEALQRPMSCFLEITLDHCRGSSRSAQDKDRCVQVLVRDNNVDQALKALKKKMQREGIFREMKLRGHYEKPSEKRAREKAEAVRRARKLARKKMQREGLLPMKPKPVVGAR